MCIILLWSIVGFPIRNCSFWVNPVILSDYHLYWIRCDGFQVFMYNTSYRGSEAFPLTCMLHCGCWAWLFLMDPNTVWRFYAILCYCISTGWVWEQCWLTVCVTCMPCTCLVDCESWMLVWTWFSELLCIVWEYIES